MTKLQYKSFFNILKINGERLINIVFGYESLRYDRNYGKNNNVYFYKIVQNNNNQELEKSMNELLDKDEYIHDQVSISGEYIFRQIYRTVYKYLFGWFILLFGTTINSNTMLTNYLQENRFIEDKSLK